MWYTSIQQLVSRVGHPDQEVVDVVLRALIRIAVAHPREAVWSVGSLMLSLNDARRKAGKTVVSGTITALSREGRQSEVDVYSSAGILFGDLIKHAQFQTSDKRCPLTIKGGVNLENFVVPNRETLTAVLEHNRSSHATAGLSSSRGGSASGGGGGGGEWGSFDPFPRSSERILRFHEQSSVMHSKAKPKKLTLEKTGGTQANYLCKQEKNGDLRKDARLMEFAAVVNRMLQRDMAGRHRGLRLRTFAVVCLNEECGLLEWVPDTAPIRTLFTEAYNAHPPIAMPKFTSPECRDAFCSLQVERSLPPQEIGARFRRDFCQQFTPCFHRWFLNTFKEPTAWFEARTAFARSTAVWSAIGHVVGLGDRHCENILVDQKNGECVHVDFDCLFDKGVTLARPEVVPFRLTSHMADGMGVAGYEGIFRRVMEVIVSISFSSVYFYKKAEVKIIMIILFDQHQHLQVSLSFLARLMNK